MFPVPVNQRPFLLRVGAMNTLAPLVSTVLADPKLLIDRHAADVSHHLALLVTTPHTDRSTLGTDYARSRGFLKLRLLSFFRQA
jgi:hypothetical protein